MSNIVNIDAEIDLCDLDFEDLVEELKDRIDDGLNGQERKHLERLAKSMGLNSMLETPYNSLNNDLAIEWFEKITKKYTVWELEKMIPA